MNAYLQLRVIYMEGYGLRIRIKIDAVENSNRSKTRVPPG